MSTRITKSRRNVSQPMLQTLEQRQLFAADLVVTSIVAQPQVLERFTGFKATITVANQGDQIVLPGVDVRLVFSRDDVYLNNDDLGLGLYSTNKVLGPGDFETFEIERRAAGQPTGQFRLAAKVDPYNKVIESHGGNNVLFSDANIVTYYDQLLKNTIDGTLGNDRISISQRDGKALITVNGSVRGADLNKFEEFRLNGAAGNDRILADADFPLRLAITGGGGNDTIVGGAGDDELSGANGKDRVFGGAGNDYVLGSAGADRLFGEDGNDTLSGAGGNDYLYAGAGKNKLFAGAGNDRLFTSGNSNVDTLSGNAGNDLADADATDVKAGIEG